MPPSDAALIPHPLENATPTDGLDPNTVLGKVQTILEAFGPDDQTLSLSELARRTGVPKASVHRLGKELVRWGVLERHGTDYWLGIRLFEIGQRVPRQRILREVCRPFMEDLYRATGETIHLAVADGMDIVYLEKVAGHDQVARPSRVAGRMPLHCTATGRVLLAFGPRNRVERALAELTAITPRTVVQPALLQRELCRVHAAGYAVECEQVRLGHMSVAIPIVGVTASVVGALSITAPLARADADKYVTLLGMIGRRITLSLSAHAT